MSGSAIIAYSGRRPERTRTARPHDGRGLRARVRTRALTRRPAAAPRTISIRRRGSSGISAGTSPGRRCRCGRSWRWRRSAAARHPTPRRQAVRPARRRHHAREVQCIMRAGGHMTTTIARKKAKPTYRAVLRAAKKLSLADQQRLRDELAKALGVYIERPSGDERSRQRGLRLAAEVREELSQTVTGTLDETMSRLRGRTWSP